MLTPFGPAESLMSLSAAVASCWIATLSVILLARQVVGDRCWFAGLSLI
jgi:hypothetical protein